MNRSLIVFDCDGVLANSIHDSFVTALNSYLDFVSSHRLPVDRPVDPLSVFDFEKQFPGIFQSFCDLMPLANRAEDYIVLLNIISDGIADQILSQEDFDALRRDIPETVRLDYQGRFYDIRRRMQQQPDVWVKLLPSFEGIPEKVRKLSERFTPAIATSKDYKSVSLLLKQYGIGDLFERQNILDKDFSKSKRDHLQRLQEIHKIPFSKIHFIDDKVSHLSATQVLGVQGYLACWGFNSPREHIRAENEGFRLLQLDDLDTLDVS